MSVKKCLIIADEDPSEKLEIITNTLKKNGHILEPYNIDLQNEIFLKQIESGKFVLDFELIKEEIKSKYFKTRLDVVACDFNYEDPEVNGFTLIKWIKAEADQQKAPIRKAKFVLYSTEQERLISMTNTVEQLRKLINLKIDDFISRDEVNDVLVKLLTKEKNDLNDKFLDELSKHSTLRFKSIYPKFKGKSFGEISHEIEQQSHHGVLFQEALVEQTISYMVEIN
jgi:hypothetical protein